MDDLVDELVGSILDAIKDRRNRFSSAPLVTIINQNNVGRSNNSRERNSQCYSHEMYVWQDSKSRALCRMYVPRASRRPNWKLATSVLGFIFKQRRVADEYNDDASSSLRENEKDRLKVRVECRRGRNTRREKKDDFAVPETENIPREMRKHDWFIWCYLKKKYQILKNTRSNRGQRWNSYSNNLFRSI